MYFKHSVAARYESMEREAKHLRFAQAAVRIRQRLRLPEQVGIPGIGLPPPISYRWDWWTESPPLAPGQTHRSSAPFRIVLPHPTPWSVGLRRDLESSPGSLDPGQRLGRVVLDAGVLALFQLLQAGNRGRGLGPEDGQCADACGRTPLVRIRQRLDQCRDDPEFGSSSRGDLDFGISGWRRGAVFPID